MTKTIVAFFEKGVLRPTEPLSLAEGEQVEVTIRTAEQHISREEFSRYLDQIAALPMEGPHDGFSGDYDND